MNMSKTIKGSRAGALPTAGGFKGSNAQRAAIKQLESQSLPSFKEITAAQRAAAGRSAAELIESQPQERMSEALGNMNVEGFGKLSTTQADRTRVGGGNIGGASFSAISEADPNYAGKTWGVGDYGTGSRLINLTSPETIWTTMLGSANQLKTNPIVFQKLEKQFKESMKAGNLTPELEAKINQNLRLFMGEDADIRDPKIWKELDTFEKRAMMADLMMGQGLPPKKGGVALGGEKSGKGVIFKPTETLIRETEPSLLHPEHGGEAPTFAIGPRLFTIEEEMSHRPDLHPGFPVLLHGKDLGKNVRPVPNEIALPDWHKRFITLNPDRKPGYYDLALGIKGEGLPSQIIDEAYLTHLQKEGHAEGGLISDTLKGMIQSPKAAEMLDLDLAKLALERRQGMMNGGTPRQPTHLETKNVPFEQFRHSIGMADGGDIQPMAEGGAVNMQDGGILQNAFRAFVPAQVRTFVGTLAGDESPITEKNFSADELEQMRKAIMSSRQDRTAMNARLHHEAIQKAPTANERRELFNRGPSKELDQTVGYQHYPGIPTGLRDDLSLSSDSAIRNTLGRFAYNKDANGNLIATDLYKFKDDLIGTARPSSDYADMGFMEKLLTLGKDTFTGAGIDTLPSRVGSAFLGNKPGRPVTVNLGKAPFAGGGVVHPSPEEMLIEMMERGYGRN